MGRRRRRRGLNPRPDAASHFQVCALGVSSAVPAYGRHLSAQAVQHNHRLFLLDCGEGTQYQLNRFKFRTRRLDAVFISHLHGDHVLGLAGLLSTQSMNGREKPLVIAGPKGLRELVETQIRLTHAWLNYEALWTEIEDPETPQTVFENDNLQVASFPLRHRIPCVGYRLQEKKRRPAFLAARAELDEIPRTYYHLLKQGNTVTLPDGREIRPEPYLGETPPVASYAYCSDTRYHPELTEHIRGVNLLYHEATFNNAMQAQAEATMHSTAEEAARAALAAEAGALLLGHFSARYFDLEPLVEEARAIFPESYAAVEGAFYSVDDFYPDDDDDPEAENDPDQPDPAESDAEEE